LAEKRFNAKDAKDAKSSERNSFTWLFAFLAVLALTKSTVVEVAHSSAALALALCRAGPGHADVERLEVEDEPPEGLLGFDVG